MIEKQRYYDQDESRTRSNSISCNASIVVWREMQSMTSQYLKAASFCSSDNLNTVFRRMGLTIRITEAHIPAPPLGDPKTSSGRFSLRKALAISVANCCSSSPAASVISCHIEIPIQLTASYFFL